MAGQGTTGTGDKSQATQSFFVFVRDNSTGAITSVVVPGDVQVGLNGNPADLTLLGRLAVAAKNYDVTFANKGILQTSPDDTIIGVSLVTTPVSGRITLYLSQSPREGELHFVKDLTGTSDTVPIDIYPTSGYTIDGKAKVTLSDPTASLALVFLNGNWYRLVAGLGTSGGSGADPLAEYVLLGGDGGLPNARTLQVASNLTMTDTGPEGTITLNLSQILGGGAGTYTYATVTADAYGRITGLANGATPPPANASYIVAQNEPALPDRRLLTGTKGVFTTDGGIASTMGLSIDPSYFVAQGNVSIFVQNGNLVISGSNTGGIGIQNAPAQAEYLLLQLTSALPQGRLVTPGRGITVVDSGPNNNFTFNVNDNVVAMVSGTTFTGPIKAPSITGTLGIVAQGLATGGGFSGTLQTLADGHTRYLVGIGSVTVTTQSNGQVIISGSGGSPPVTNITGAGGSAVSSVGTLFTVSSSIYADDFASYVITSGSSNQPPNARKLIAGSQVSLVDGGPGGNLTINVSASVVASSSIGANLFASYLLTNPDAEDVNARTIVAGSNISFADTGPGGTFTISSTGGGGGGGGAAPTSNALTVITASLTSSITLAQQPSFKSLAAITSSLTDIAFWAKASGNSTGLNTIWMRLLVDGLPVPNLASFEETVTNGAGWGGSFSGRVAGLAAGTHKYDFQAAVGSAANFPTIDPTLAGTPDQQGATLMIMSLSASVFNNYITGAFNGYTARYTSPDTATLHQWRCLDSGSTTLIDNVDSAPMTIDNSQVPGTPILLGQTSLFDGAIRTFGNANSCFTTDNISEPPSASFSMDCWIQWDSNSGNQYIFGRQWKDPLDGSNFSAISLATTGEGTLGYWITLQGGGEVGGYSKFSTNAGDNSWHHIGLTFDGLFVRLFYDGDKVFQESRVGNADFTFPAPWFLGQFKTTPGTNRSFTGKICDARISTGIRPESYFRSLYQLGIGWASGSTFIASTTLTTTGSGVAPDANDYLWWPCTDTQGPTVVNYGTAGAIGNLTASSGNVHFNQVGPLRNSIGANTAGQVNNFLGNDHLATQPTPNTSSITVSAWFRPENITTATHQKIVVKSYFNTISSWNTPFIAIDLGLAGNSDGKMEYGFSGISVSGPTTVSSGSCATANEWNHAGMSYDGATVRCYLNGVLIYAFASTGAIDYSGNGWWAVGGNQAIPTSEYFQGQTADVRVANTVRNDAWFAQVWASGRPDAASAIQLFLTGVALLGGGGGSGTVTSGSLSGPNAWVEGGVSTVGPKDTQIRTTSSVSISDSAENIYAGMKGTDVWFYVSGTQGLGPGNPDRLVTLFGGDVVISGTLNAATASIPFLTSSNAVLTGAITVMANGNPLFIGIGGVGITTNSVGQIVVSSSKGSSGGTSGINVQNQGATLPASPYQTINFTGPGVSTSDIGGVATVNIPGATPGNVPGSFASYYGFCTGSLLWSATGAWTNALGVPGNFTDGISVNILRNGSTFSVLQTGLYNFRSFFNAMAGANGTYIAFRLSGSNGPIISRTTFATDNQQPAILEGLMQLNSGSTFTLQYLTSGSTEQPWTPSDPNGVGVDTANMRTGEIGIFLVPSGSATVNNYAITASVGNTAYSPANAAIVTSSFSFPLDTSAGAFINVTGVSASITTSGYPILIMVNASWNSQAAGSQALFSVARDGTNLGGASGLQGAGPTALSYNNNASFAYVDFAPAGVHNYNMLAKGTVGSGYIGAAGVGPTAIMLFEMKGANVVTASTTLNQAVPGGNLIGLSASILVNHGPVLCIGSSNMSSDAGGNWCWFDIFRNGSSLANGAGQGLSVNVGSATNEIQGNCIMVLDQSPTVGATNTYTMRATNGAGTNHVNNSNLVSSLILWELSDVNFKYSFSTTQVTPATIPSFTDVDVQNPTAGLVTRGRPVLLVSTINSNTSGGGGRGGYTFFRNGSNVVTSSKGMQIADGEGNSDWNKMPTLFWIDTVPAGFYQYQVMGTVVSSSAFTAQGSYTYLFMYELDPGGPGVIIDGWFDEGNFLFTTASIQALGNASFGNTTVTQLTQVGGNTLSVFSGSVTILGTLTFASGSGMAITGSSVSRQYNIPFLSAMVTSPQFSGSKANLGVHWYDPNKLNTGIDTLNYKFRSLFAPVFGNGNAYVDLYDYNGIINGTPGPVSGSVLTASLPSTLTRQEIDITTALTGITGSGIFLARAWVEPSGSNFVNVGGTELVLEWR